MANPSDDPTNISDAPAPPQDNGQAAYNYFVGQGLAPHQAAGIVGNLQGESGQSLDPNAVNAGDGTDGSDSIGIGQWNGARAQALKDYAASKGKPWNDLNTQLEFVNSELQGPESKAYGALQAAQTPEDAAHAMLGYERPKDWNKPGSHPERAAYAKAVYAAYGPGGTGAVAPTQNQGLVANQNQAPTPSLPAAPANPIFAGASALPSGLGSAAGAFQPFQATPTPSPIFAPPRKQIDLSGLRAALARMPILTSFQGISGA